MKICPVEFSKKAAFYYDAEIKLFNCSRNVVFFVNQIKLKLASIKVSNEHQVLLTWELIFCWGKAEVYIYFEGH